MEEILVYFAVKYQGDWDMIYDAINKKEKVDQDELKETLSKVDSEYLTLLSDNYPFRLKNIYKPPFVLFYKGDINLTNSKSKSVAVVGSRENSEYGEYATKKIVKELVDNECVIVSGLAKGIDSIAHKTCLENNGKTIAVLGNGMDKWYPLENKDLQDEISLKGLVISEYPNGVISSKENFPKRNRIVAGISDGVLVSEAKCKSGSMITVTRALEMGKEVFCIPDKICNDSGCNNLIKEGAKLVESAKDILNDL